MPAAIASSIAGFPSFVPGILMKRFGRFAFLCNLVAAATDPLVLIRQKRRHLGEKRNHHCLPYARGPRGKEVGGPSQILDGQCSKNNSSPEKDLLREDGQSPRHRICSLKSHASKDCWVRSQSCHRKLHRYSAFQCSSASSKSRVMLSSHKLPASEIMEFLGRLHRPLLLTVASARAILPTPAASRNNSALKASDSSFS